jgi:hypothetical protein
VLTANEKPPKYLRILKFLSHHKDGLPTIQ